jgi:transglutaminase-like putative cysteine protease
VGESIADLPADLRPIATLLLNADLSGEEGAGGPTASEPDVQVEIEDERQQLVPRFLTVRWTADDSGAVDTLYVTGQIPVYDDVDAVFGQTSVSAGTPYKVSGSSSSASRQDLANAGTDYPDWVRDRYLSLPETVSPRTFELTRQLTVAAANPSEKARIIEQYLRATIVYDENVAAPPADADLVDYLLFERQRGYCEYYASAMAVMLRTAGVPARVVVGFYPGEYDQDQGGFLYRQENAHAWVEAFFPGHGWIAFEPTASQPMVEIGNVGSDEGGTPTATPQPQDIASPEPSTPVANLEDSSGVDPLRSRMTPDVDGNGSRWIWILAVGVAAAVALGGAGWLVWSIPLRGAPLSSALFVRLRRLGRFLGVSSTVTETPREYAQSFADAVPASRDHVTRIVNAYELDQFGPAPADNRLVSAATNAWLSIRRQLPSWIIRHCLKRK